MDEQYLGLGNGSDGFVTLTSHSPVDSACSGTVDTTSVSATNSGFAAGQYIKIIQMQGGSNYGKQEINRIASYVAGTITTLNKLKYTYSSSGSNRAQVIVMPQYAGVTIGLGFYIKAWNGSVGGHLTFLCTGRVNNPGWSVLGTGRGFRGGDRENSGSASSAEQGDSPQNSPSRSQSPNGCGGGGARDGGGGQGASGGGAGNASTGTNGAQTSGQSLGQAGTAIDSTTLTTRFCMGAGGGGGIGPGGNDSGGYGGLGGGSADIFCYEFLNLATGVWAFNGNAGNTPNPNYGSYTAGPYDSNVGGSQGSGGGGGAGGDFRVTCVKFVNYGTITSYAGSGGGSNNSGTNGPGGNGSVGVIGIRCCSYTNTGTIYPATSVVAGGYSFCGTGAQIM